MDFDYSPKVDALRQKLGAFMDEFVYPNQRRYQEADSAADRWRPNPVVEELKPKARAAGLWNLFLPESTKGAGLSNLEYAPLCEIMGRVEWAPEVFNCSAPDTGNMEILERFGSEAQKAQWLRPLLAGEIRSGFAMTEPAVASSDATNIESQIRREADAYVINGRKWWTSGAMDPRCAIFIFMGKTDAANPDRYRQQSVWLERIAQSRILIEQARLLTLNAAHRMDTVGNKAARAEIAMIKVAAPEMLCRVLDWAIQAHGAAGLSADVPLAQAYAYARSVQIVDGPDEVHRNQIGRLELRKYETREPTAP